MRMSPGQMSLILLVDLIVSDASIAVEKLPDLLQIILVLWDHHSSIVQEQAREMLVHLVYVFVISKTDEAQTSGRNPSIEELVELIRRNDTKIVWAYSDNSDQFSPFELPKSMNYVISETIALFSLTVPGIEEALGRTAVNWAIQCPVRHVACRSLQIYRRIQQPIDKIIFGEILYRLSATISEGDPDVQAYVADILRTIQAIAESRPEASPLFPQLFWTSCVALESVHEWEYAAAASIFEIVLNKCDLLDENRTANFKRFRPEAWDRTILSGFASSLCKGCSSRTSYDKSVDLINKTLSIGCSPSFRDGGYLRLGVLANLPRMLHSFDDPAYRSSCIAPSITLRDCCGTLNEQTLCLIFDDYGTNRLTKQDLILRCLANKRISLLEKMNFESIYFLMQLLLNPLPWLKRATLLILDHLLPRIDLEDQKIRTCGLDLFSPLLRLLQTEYCPEALGVVDHVLLLTGVCKDIRYLQPVQSPTDSGKAGRAQIVNGGSLYGKPTDTGWSVPSPDFNKTNIRQNILSISHKLGKTDEFGHPAALTPEVEFYKEETTQDSYFPEQTIPEGTSSLISPTDPSWDVDTSMTQLAAQIGDLDDFFEDGPSDPMPDFDSSGRSTTGPTRKDTFSTIHHQSKLSTSQLSNIHTHHKPGSNGSSISEVSNHSPLFPPKVVPQVPPPMSPSAFATPSNSEPGPPPRPQNSDTQLLTRPRMGSRSITAPSTTLQTTTPEKALPKPSVEPEPFSDDDLSARPTQGDRSDSNPPSRGNTPQKPFSTLRNSIKRLAGSERHRRTNTRAQLEVTVEVPPVPNLPSTQSSTSSEADQRGA